MSFGTICPPSGNPYAIAAIDKLPGAARSVVPPTTAPSKTEADSVSISAEGTRRAKSDSAPPDLMGMKDLSYALHNNPDKAEVASIVERTANELDQQLVSIGPAPAYTVRYAGTGQLVTEQSTAAFNANAEQAQAGRQSIYRQELALGTDPADIFDKLVNYMQSQPGDFKLQAGRWGMLQAA